MKQIKAYIEEERALFRKGCTVKELAALRAKHGDKEAEELLERLPDQRVPNKIIVTKL